MDMENDTAVYDAMAYNTGTVAYDMWKGVGLVQLLNLLVIDSKWRR
jgi:hypothetical protein